MTPVQVGALLGLLAGVATAIAVASAGDRPVAVALDCRSGTPAVRPHRLDLACGDAAIRAVAISWHARMTWPEGETTIVTEDAKGWPCNDPDRGPSLRIRATVRR